MPTNNPSIRYPKDGLYDEHTDYVRFTFFEYIPPFSSGGGAGRQDYSAKRITEAERENSLSTVILYMPEDIQSAFASDWGDKSFTNVQRDALNLAGGAFSKGANPGTVVKSVVEAAKNIPGRLPSVIGQQVANAINAIPGGIGGNTDLNTVLGGVKGVVLNPNVELLFQGFGLREFDLNYKFTPRNKDEALDIRKIINTFKIASLPKFGTAPGLRGLVADPRTGETIRDKDSNSGNNNYITIPNLCLVEFMKGASQHPYLPKWKLSAITGVDVNYTPDGSYATYEDGSPVATGLSLRFAETKLVYGDEINVDSNEAQY